MIKKKTIILISISVLTLYCIFYMFWNFEHTLVTSISPQKNNKLVISYIEPISFGEHKIKVFYGSNKSFFKITKKSFITFLDNKGMNLNKSNYRINWINDNKVNIKLIGFDSLRTKIYEIDFETNKVLH